MEIVPYFERRMYSQMSHPYQSQTHHFQDGIRKDNLPQTYTESMFQLPHWQVDHARYSCNPTPTNHCLHRHSLPTSSEAPEFQAHTSIWHPYNYTGDAFLSARPSDPQLYEETVQKQSQTRQTYHNKPRDPVESQTATHAQKENSQIGLTDTFNRATRSMEGYAPNPYTPFYRNSSFGDSAHDMKRDWDFAFMKSLPYCKL